MSFNLNPSGSTPLIDDMFFHDREKREEAICLLLVDIDLRETQARLRNLSTGHILLSYLSDKFDTSFRHYLGGGVDTLDKVINRIEDFDGLREHFLDEYFLVKSWFASYFDDMRTFLHNSKLDELIPRYDLAVDQLQSVIANFQDEEEYLEDEYNCALIEHNERLISAKKQK